MWAPNIVRNGLAPRGTVRRAPLTRCSPRGASTTIPSRRKTACAWCRQPWRHVRVLAPHLRDRFVILCCCAEALPIPPAAPAPPITLGAATVPANSHCRVPSRKPDRRGNLGCEVPHSTTRRLCDAAGMRDCVANPCQPAVRVLLPLTRLEVVTARTAEGQQRGERCDAGRRADEHHRRFAAGTTRKLSGFTGMLAIVGPAINERIRANGRHRFLRKDRTCS